MAMKTDAARSCTVSTPDGPFTIVTGHGGADGAADGVARTDYVLASGWTAEIAKLVGLIPPSLRPSHTEALPEVECDGLLARAVIVVDEKGTVVHSQLVPEITTEPDYEAAIAAL